MALKRPADDVLFIEPPTKIHRSQFEEDTERDSSSAYMNVLALIAESEGMRILRAEEEEDGEEAKTHDFAVYFSIHWFLKLPDTCCVSESVRRIGPHGGQG
jgi:hypothetical protein